MKIHNAEQSSLDWLYDRAGVITASEFSEIVDTKFEPRTGETPKTYMAQKLAERWIQGPLMGFSSFATEQGNILEDEARPWFELTHECEVQRVGLVTTDDGRIGCSPDGLIDPDGGIEIKCPEPTAHVKYLLAGELPKQYAAQVHGSMLVTGRPWWKFVSYRRRFPAFVLHVNRDEKIIGKLQEALDEFLEAYDAAYQKLCERNGGPPKVRSRPVLTPESRPQPEAPFDNMP